ncbi:MAG: tRNA 4-thiouridine(8) synthase ThiI, partial [Lachnospiraceae bacterium]|nr:tRNA 4-thiouridine(8) synthase ThiI [Lachnospiraceae bacterium]
MKYDSFLIKYGEIGLKGKNRYVFEDALMKRIRYALKDIGEFEVYKERGRVYIDALGEYDYDSAIEALTRVFGIVAICPVVHVNSKKWENMTQAVGDHMENIYGNKPLTFKVEARRADKSFPKDSMTINADMGEYLLDRFDNLKVNVHEPDVLINIEIREKVHIYSETIKGAGGMPVGTSGKAMLLLSGGIDSPVAGYMVARRGVEVEAVYFHAPPYSSERAKQKVVDLAAIISRYTGPIRLHIINFTDIQ